MPGLQELIVVIPAYRKEMEDWERFAFTNNVRRLRNYPVVMLVPQSLDCADYLSAAPSISIVRFPDAFFTSADSYSRLCLSAGLYEAFSKYRYLLICQLDAYVFSDDLGHWTSRGYDYVGGAVSKTDIRSGHFIRWIESQNGGLSLRNVASHLRVLQPTRKINCTALQYNLHRDMVGTTREVDGSISYRARIAAHALVKRWRSRFKDMDSAGLIASFAPGHTLAEDQFWSRYAPRYDDTFKVASLADAQRFSAQFSLDITLPQFRNVVPFGCHGSEIVAAMYRLSGAKVHPADVYERLVHELMMLTGTEMSVDGHPPLVKLKGKSLDG